MKLLDLVQHEGVEHIPREGSATVVLNHNSPLDFFYVQVLMDRTGRRNYRCVVAAELLQQHAFLPYVKNTFRDEVPNVGQHLGWLAHILSYIVPPMLQRIEPIPVYRKGDDSESRMLSLECLQKGELLIVAPGRNRERNSKGVRKFTHGVASIARRYFEAAGKPLSVIPVGVKQLPGMLPRALLRVGFPFQGMSDVEYPELFSATGRTNKEVKHKAYQRYTRQLELLVMDLL
jgi:1-acyl-sn-glycerol-3-phosphate acyltransferase